MMNSAKRISRTSTITLNSSLETVFPLFGPVKEMEWAEGWQPEIIYSQADITYTYTALNERDRRDHQPKSD